MCTAVTSFFPCVSASLPSASGWSASEAKNMLPGTEYSTYWSDTDMSHFGNNPGFSPKLIFWCLKSKIWLQWATMKCWLCWLVYCHLACKWSFSLILKFHKMTHIYLGFSFLHITLHVQLLLDQRCSGGEFVQFPPDSFSKRIPKSLFSQFNGTVSPPGQSQTASPLWIQKTLRERRMKIAITCRVI